MARKKKETHKDLEVITFKNQSLWLKWLDKRHSQREGIWIKLAKKKSGIASVTYEEAREAAIMYGWIDGLINKYDERYYLIRFTARRARSPWSKINREIATQLLKAKKMKPSGKREVDAAKKDGRWDSAYDSTGTIEIPRELKQFFRRNKKAKRFFDSMSGANRHAMLYRIQSAKRPETREKRVVATIETLRNEQIFHPNR